MEPIRKATVEDVSRIAEILVFTKRVHYRAIFQNDQVSFGEIQVLPLANAYLADPARLQNIFVYDDGFVKGMLHIEAAEIQELYVDCFFQGQGIGGKLIDYAVEHAAARWLLVLEKNASAIAFYQKHGFSLTGERMPEPGTPEFLVKMRLARA